MEVGVDHTLDAQPVLVGVVEILADVPARIDHHRSAGALVTDQVRRVRQALDVVLLENHAFLHRVDVLGMCNMVPYTP